MFPMMSLAVTTLSLGVQAPSALAELFWLTGRWTGSAANTDTEEVWMAPAVGVMVGMHRDVSASRQFFHEFLMIRESPDGIDYVASPRGASPTAFRLTDGGTSHAVFTNPDHDFPQRIEYRLTDVSGRDLGVYLLVITTLLVVGLVASSLPAMRTIRVDPAQALRAD